MAAVTSTWAAQADQRLIKIAVPNKGALSDAAALMLHEAGYAQRSDSKELVLLDEVNGVEFFYLRPRDIAVYVGEGTLDVGITGRDMLLDSGAAATERLSLNFGASRFRFAAPAGSDLTVEKLEGLRLATSYPGLVGAHLAERGVSVRLIRLDGAVETAIRLGVADVIADVVETGTTLRQAGLETIGNPILTSSAVLIRRLDAPGDGAAAQLLRRLQGVLVARRYVMLAYDVRAELLEAATALTPGIESPTGSQLDREGWLAVQAMVTRTDMHRVMDELYELGARAILVTDIHACRL